MLPAASTSSASTRCRARRRATSSASTRERPYLLFAADPSRAIKRYDLALELARAVDVELLALGGVDPQRAPLWFNAANAVLMPSEHEGFGLAVLEALACDVPVLATPVGIHPRGAARRRGDALRAVRARAWRAALEPHLRRDGAADPGARPAPSRSPARAMAERVAAAWRTALRDAG